MDLKCEKCSQNYHVPENKIEDRKVYFICERCGHKIVIDPPRERWQLKGVFKSSPLKAGSIPEAVASSFSFKSTALAFCFLYVIALIGSLAAFLVYKNLSFFASHPVFTATIAFILIVLLKYAYDFMLYLISLNAFHRFEHNRNILFSSVSGQIASDAGKILFFSSAGFFALVILSAPIYFFKGAGPLYAALFFPVIFPAAVLTLWAWISRGFLYSILALNMKSVKHTLRTAWRFITVENLNIPAYSLIIKISMCFISLIIIAVIFLPLAFFTFTTGLFADTARADTADYSEAATVILTFFLSIIAVSAASWITVIRQTMYAAAIKIMDSNPGESVSGKTKVIGMILLWAFLLITVVLVSTLFASGALKAVLTGIKAGAGL